MHKCKLTYKINNVEKVTYLYYKDELSEALDNFFLFNNKEDVEIISLQLKRHYPNYMDIEEKIYYPDDEELKKLLA